MLLALVGRDLTKAASDRRLSPLLQLNQGFSLLPLTLGKLESLSGYTFPSHIEADDGFPVLLNRAIARSIANLQESPFTYLEIECDGGPCQRTTALFHDKRTVWVASQIDTLISGGWPTAVAPDWFPSERVTNVALRELGVDATGFHDELDALGLTRMPFRTAWPSADEFRIVATGDE